MISRIHSVPVENNIIINTGTGIYFLHARNSRIYTSVVCVIPSRISVISVGGGSHLFVSGQDGYLAPILVEHCEKHFDIIVSQANAAH